MKNAPRSVLLVPPLSAYGDGPSMSLYWRNVSESITALDRASFSIRAITPPLSWRESKARRRICQRVVMPFMVRQAITQERQAGRRPVVHVLDQHYAHLLPRDGTGTITCHDLNILVSPERGLLKTEERNRLRRITRAGTIHAISQNTARDIEHFFPEVASRVVVNYYGINPVFCPRPIAPDLPHLAKLHAANGAFFVLHVGSNLERKNIPVLLKGFAEAKARLAGRQVKLIKVGNDLRTDGFGAMIEELGIADEVIHLGALDVSQLVDVYNACHVLAFPSLYEGFGRPVAEAQACGLPCILAKTSSLPEVGGIAALYHPADGAEALARHIADVATNHDLRQRLMAAGLENVKRFTWRRHAELLAASYLGCDQRTPIVA